MEVRVREAIASICQFSEPEWLLIEHQLERLTVQKHAFLLREGQVCRSVFFVLEGSYRRFTNRPDGVEETVGLHVANDWMADPASLVAQKPSDSCLQACESGVVVGLSLPAIHALIEQKPVFFQLGRLLDVLHPEPHPGGNPVSADIQYAHLLATRPQVIQKFPLKQIASFLKMAPETLSRIRSRQP